MATDRPTVHVTRSKLQPDTKAGPFVFGAKAEDKNVRVTFPDPDDMPWQEAEDLLSDLLNPQVSPKQALLRWLDDDNYADLERLGLTFGEMRTLMDQVGDHYKAIFGAPGESDASQA